MQYGSIAASFSNFSENNSLHCRGTVSQIQKDLIHKIARRVASESGFEIYSIIIQFRKGRLTIDARIDNGAIVSHDDCGNFSSRFSDALTNEGVGDDFYLEVSSPGLKRKLRNSAEFMRFVGAPVKVVYPKGDGFHTYKAVLCSADDEKVEVEENGKKEILYIDKIKQANLDY